MFGTSSKSEASKKMAAMNENELIAMHIEATVQAHNIEEEMKRRGFEMKVHKLTVPMANAQDLTEFTKGLGNKEKTSDTSESNQSLIGALKNKFKEIEAGKEAEDEGLEAQHISNERGYYKALSQAQQRQLQGYELIVSGMGEEIAAKKFFDRVKKNINRGRYKN